MEETLISVIEILRKSGYTEDFSISQKDNGLGEITPDDFLIDKIYRFEGMTDMEDESILYAISSKDGKRKGILINGYGIYSGEKVNKLIEKMNKRI